MPRMCKGQTVLIDLTFAVIVFVLVFLTLNTFYAEKISLHNNSAEISEMAFLANNASASLLKTKGIPENWDVLPTAQIVQIGLLGNGNSIDEEKLNAFRNLISDYNTTKELLNIYGYDYFFRLRANPDINAGLPPMSIADKAVVSRTVNYNGGEYDAEFTLYKIR